jgi:tRNA(Ile2) C34 agmatinyltransferase TiaS
MDVNIKCILCGQILSFGAMTKQSIKQSANQAFNWKVILGLQKIEWIPTCESCGKQGKESFCCSKCESKLIWSEDIIKSGKLTHKCS